MKTRIFLLLALPLMWTCSESPSTTNEDKNIAIVEKYIQAVENLDYDNMASLLAEDYVGLGPSFNDSISKDQALSSWKNNIEHLYQSIKYNRMQNAGVMIKDGPNAGEWVSSWAELKINYQDGNNATIWANTTYRIVDEKIAKTFTFYNEADVLEQLGYVFIHSDKF